MRYTQIEGEFGVKVGSSSSDIRLSGSFSYYGSSGNSEEGSDGWESLSTTEQGIIIAAVIAFACICIIALSYWVYVSRVNSEFSVDRKSLIIGVRS
jgi:hypothetical protein